MEKQFSSEYFLWASLAILTLAVCTLLIISRSEEVQSFIDNETRDTTNALETNEIDDSSAVLGKQTVQYPLFLEFEDLILNSNFRETTTINNGNVQNIFGFDIFKSNIETYVLISETEFSEFSIQTTRYKNHRFKLLASGKGELRVSVNDSANSFSDIEDSIIIDFYSNLKETVFRIESVSGDFKIDSISLELL